MKLSKHDVYEIQAAAFRILTGHAAPGKDPSPLSDTAPLAERMVAWNAWRAEHGPIILAMIHAINEALDDDADSLRAELEACVATLPGSLYMDPPDGGDVPPSEQLRRMAQDAARYRYLERKVAIAGAQFHFLNVPPPVHFCAPSAAAELRAVIDMVIDAPVCERPPTPIGWSDTDWTKHLEEQQHPLAGLHINQGSMDAAADAYEAEYNAAQEARLVEAKRVR